MFQELHVTVPEVQWLYTQDWVYWQEGDCQRCLQLLVPHQNPARAARKFPLILLIPGAAWHRQEMYNDIPLYARLAERGYAVVALQVRESDIAPFPAQVEDVCHALEFIATIAERFAMDMSRIFLMGNSSGGHIAMMAALFAAHGRCSLPPLRGVICESGSTDLLLCAREPLPPWMKVRPTAVLLGVESIEGHEEMARQASCGPYIVEGVKLPPVLLIHADRDPVVSVEHSRQLYRQLTETGHDADLCELKNCDAHGGAVFYEPAVLNAVQAFCERC